MADTDKDIGRLEGKIDMLVEGQHNILKLLQGNGQKGLIEKQASSEAFMTAHCAKAQETFESIRAFEMESLKDRGVIKTALETNQDETRKAIGGLTASVDKHHADKSQHTIWGQLTWKAAGILIFVVAVIVAIIPQELSVWQLITQLLGYAK
jgi:hypothetical protein